MPVRPSKSWGSVHRQKGSSITKNSQGDLASWLIPLLAGLVVGTGLNWHLVHRNDLHNRILKGLASLSHGEQHRFDNPKVPRMERAEGVKGAGEERDESWSVEKAMEEATLARKREQLAAEESSSNSGGAGVVRVPGVVDLPTLDGHSELGQALRESAVASQKALEQIQQTGRDSDALLEPLLDRSLQHLEAQRRFLENEHVVEIDSGTARALARVAWVNPVCSRMRWTARNLSTLLEGYREEGRVPSERGLIEECMRMWAETTALEDEHQRVMQEAQQLAYEMSRVDVQMKRMAWLDDHRPWWEGFKQSVKERFKVSLVEHTMDGVRSIFYRIKERERWVLIKFLSCYLPYAKEWESGWPEHKAVIERSEALMTSLGNALSKYVEIEWKFRAADTKLEDHCGLSLPNKNWTSVHDKALDDMALAVQLSGSTVGRCAELEMVEEELSRRPVMQGPKRMWEKDPELMSPQDKPRFSFLLQYRGRAERVPKIVDSLYQCTRGMLGDGLLTGMTSEMYVNMLDPYKTMWPWIKTWVSTDQGRFVVPVLPQLVPDNAGINDLAFMARGDILIVIYSDELPPKSCDWLKDISTAFDAWPHLGLVGFHSPSPDATSASAESSSQEGSRKDPSTGLGMRFAETVNSGGVVGMRRQVFQFLGGLDEVDGREGGESVETSVRLSTRVWLSGHQVASLEAQRHGALDFFGAKQGSKSDQSGEERYYKEYDDFLVEYTDIVKEEVDRLNRLLLPENA